MKVSILILDQKTYTLYLVENSFLIPDEFFSGSNGTTSRERRGSVWSPRDWICLRRRSVGLNQSESGFHPLNPAQKQQNLEGKVKCLYLVEILQPCYCQDPSSETQCPPDGTPETHLCPSFVASRLEYFIPHFICYLLD